VYTTPMKRIPCPISDTELRRMYLDEKFTDQQIAGQIGETSKRVRSWRKLFGIPTISMTERYDVYPIEGQLRSLLVGSMLGDGHITCSHGRCRSQGRNQSRNSNTARYVENHADNQKDYLEWKRKQWGPWSKGSLAPVRWARERKVSNGWIFRTVSHASLLPWYELFYPVRGPKQLSSEVPELVNSFSLAIWYLDDGSAQWWPIITFGMNSVSRGIATSIFERFGLSPRWNLHKGNTGEFVFHGEEQAERFIQLVGPHVPECMRYKLQFGFQGRYYEIRKIASEDRLREMVMADISIRRMARVLGLSASVVSRRLTKLGLAHSRNMRRPMTPNLGGSPHANVY
jgi:hypothetical protein